MAGSVRMNITVPQDVAETLKEMAGPREQSSFIAKSVRLYARQLKRKQLIAELKEGYQAAAREGASVSEDFDAALIDGLDDEHLER